ncbi:hypothetical protein MKW98_003971 [Papaver atlanticum]|uniref:TF-B3 domain-containing protein n=1 Tax=Papaver atlanticum TaxID=357466 RepID=A0AAD4XFY7_9MAGN|nr:hypothetical protein MKW98_003971 [Papaver atlanticum]
MERMVCSSSKPHFFQPILPGSSSAHVRIPKAFQTDYLVDGEDSEAVATLKSTPLKKSWKVKLNDFKFTDGWEDFLKDHELGMGNVLVFEYEGHDLIFQVWVFDLSCCEVEYSTEPLMSEGGVKNETHFEEDSKESDDELEKTTEDATRMSMGPNFLATLKSYSIGRSFLPIPRIFSKAIIPDDVETVVLKDEGGKIWPIKLTRRKDTGGVNLGFGWYDFQYEKGLKEGDICLFEQENENEMEFTVRIIGKC